jgi:hypothetical protein
MATLQELLGGGLPAGLLSPEQEAAAERRAQNAALLNFAFGALQASRGAPGQAAPSLGQVIGQAGPVGVQAYQQSFDQTLANALRGMQIGELRRKQAEEDQARQARATFQQRIAAATKPATTGAGTQQAEALMGQMMFPGETAVPAAETAMTREALLSNVNLPRVTDQAAADQAVLDYLRVASPVEYAKLVSREPKAQPTSIQEYNFAVGQGYQGTFQEFVNEQKKAGAPSTTITLPGDKKMAEVLGAKGAERLDNSLNQAQEAQSTLQNISELRPILEQGVFAGPLSSAPRAVAQIASQLGVTGKDTKELLERTAVAMQGLAKFELSAAAAMRGQGAITENERILIQRAAAGRLDQFTAPEVQALLSAMEKTANFKIASHNRQLDVLKKSSSAEVRDLIPFYELAPLNIAPPAAAGRTRRFNPATGRVE